MILLHVPMTKPCRKCGHTLRYPKGGCVRCTKARVARQRGYQTHETPPMKRKRKCKIVRPSMAPGITLAMIMAGKA